MSKSIFRKQKVLVQFSDGRRISAKCVLPDGRRLHCYGSTEDEAFARLQDDLREVSIGGLVHYLAVRPVKADPPVASVSVLSVVPDIVRSVLDMG